MTKQEEVRGTLTRTLTFIRDIKDKPPIEEDVGWVMRCLSSLGVVIKGESLGGSHPHLSAYYTVESLIEGSK